MVRKLLNKLKPSEQDNERKRRLSGKVLPVVLFTVFIDVIGVGILIPVVPQLLVNPHSHAYLLSPGFNPKTALILLGFLNAIYPFMMFFATPILGQLSDKYGRKKILAISLFGTAVSYAVFAVGIINKNLALLFISRAVDGITGGNIAVAQASVADVTTPENRTRNFGLVGAVFGMGFVIGPYIGDKLAVGGVSVLNLFGHHLLTTPSWFGPSTPFWFAAGLSLVNVSLVLTRFPETLSRVQHHIKINWSKSLLNIKKAATLPGLKTIFPTVFFFTAGFGFFQGFFNVYLIRKFGFQENNIGDYFAYIGLWIVITQALITPRIAKRFANWQVLRYSLFAMAGAFLALFIPNTVPTLLAFSALVPICMGLNMANSVALVSRSAAPEIQGEVLGINASVQSLAQTIPLALSGFLAGISINEPIIVASISMAIAGLVFWTLYKPSKEVESPDPVYVQGH